MNVEYTKPISIKIWFQGVSTSRNLDGVTSMQETNGLMKISYRDKNNMRKTAIIFMANVNMLEEL